MARSSFSLNPLNDLDLQGFSVNGNFLWNNQIAYAVGSIVVHNGALWRAIIVSDNVEPTEDNSANWEQVAGGGGGLDLGALQEAIFQVNTRQRIAPTEGTFPNYTQFDITYGDHTMDTPSTGTVHQMGDEFPFYETVEYRGGAIDRLAPAGQSLFRVFEYNNTDNPAEVTNDFWTFRISNTPFTLTITAGMGFITYTPTGLNADGITRSDTDNGVINVDATEFTVANGVVTPIV